MCALVEGVSGRLRAEPLVRGRPALDAYPGLELWAPRGAAHSSGAWLGHFCTWVF